MGTTGTGIASLATGALVRRFTKPRRPRSHRPVRPRDGRAVTPGTRPETRARSSLRAAVRLRWPTDGPLWLPAGPCSYRPETRCGPKWHKADEGSLPGTLPVERALLLQKALRFGEALLRDQQIRRDVEPLL